MTLQSEFWSKLEEFCKDSGTFLSLKKKVPSGNNYGIGIGKRGVQISLRIIARKNRLDCRLKIGEKQSPIYFPPLDAQKSQIESELGELKWSYKEGGKARIWQSLRDININSRDKWPEYFAWLKERAESFHRVFTPRVKPQRLKKSKTIDQNKAIARRLYETLNQALSTGNLAALDEVIAADAVDHNPAPGQKPGVEGVKQAFGEFRIAFPDLSLTVEEMIAEGQKVACRITTRATHKGVFLGIPPTGKQVVQTGIDILRITDGKVVERWGEFDNLGLLQQLGAVKL